MDQTGQRLCANNIDTYTEKFFLNNRLRDDVEYSDPNLKKQRFYIKIIYFTL